MPDICRFDFAAPLLPPDEGTMGMAYIPLPVDVATALLSDKPRRVDGMLEGQPFSRSLQGSTVDTLHVRFGQTTLRDIGKAVGDWVEVELWPDLNPDHVALPDELTAALDADDKARDRFEGMTPGKRRSLCYHVTSAKRTETRVKRAEELTHKLSSYTLHQDKALRQRGIVPKGADA